MHGGICIMVQQDHANPCESTPNICNASRSLVCMNSRVGGGEVQENTEMKALKDAEFDQRYIFKCQAYLPLHMYVYIPPL